MKLRFIRSERLDKRFKPLNGLTYQNSPYRGLYSGTKGARILLSPQALRRWFKNRRRTQVYKQRHKGNRNAKAT